MREEREQVGIFFRGGERVIRKVYRGVDVKCSNLFLSCIQNKLSAEMVLEMIKCESDVFYWSWPAPKRVSNRQ